MVSFKLSKEIEKYVFRLSPAWDKEKILSPHQESNLRLSDSALRCSTTEPQRHYGEQGLYKVPMTLILQMLGSTMSTLIASCL